MPCTILTQWGGVAGLGGAALLLGAVAALRPSGGRPVRDSDRAVRTRHPGRELAAPCCDIAALRDLQRRGHAALLGLDWAFWPIGGWGLGVLLQGIRVFRFRTSWEDRKARELYEEEQERESQSH